MLIGEHRVNVARPIEAVFDAVVESLRHLSWRGEAVAARLRSGDGGVGSLWCWEVRGLGGRVTEVEYRVTELARPHRVAFELTGGPARGGSEYTLAAPAAGVTTVHVCIRRRPRGLVAGWTGVIPRQVSAELDALDRLRSALEGDGA